MVTLGCSVPIQYIRSTQGHRHKSILVNESIPVTERTHVFTFAIDLALRGKCQGFDISRQTWQCNVKHNRLRVETAMVLPADGGFSTDLLEEMSKSPLFRGAVVTNDWCWDDHA